jgi:hypothetical protein
MLSAARLRELLVYDPLTGAFRWRVTRGRCRAGTVAGSATSDGYHRVMLDGEEHQAHRLAWLYMTGAEPAAEVDHIDGIKKNNVWTNLRDVPRQINSQNQRGPCRDSRAGLLGVCAKREKWQAQIGHEGTTRYLGVYATKEAAHNAYIAAKRSLHVGCTI